MDFIFYTVFSHFDDEFSGEELKIESQPWEGPLKDIKISYAPQNIRSGSRIACEAAEKLGKNKITAKLGLVGRKCIIYEFVLVFRSCRPFLEMISEG